ncbi:M15 family metallopeptidase [Chitinophaga sp. 30R24]|uniref:M15 family metallopeptidase n=1 Tax=Chitinophaga sp. 30R24 TaxID=3248838 RepID=UPI003B8F3174
MLVSLASPSKKTTVVSRASRISKKVKNVETWYIRDATGNVMGIYTKGDSSVNNGDLTLTETHLYGSSRLGLLNRQVNVEHIVAPETVALANGTGLNTIFKRGYKVFELGNHLGNVLASVSDRKRPISLNGSTISYFDPVLTSVQDYYPFGMLMPGRSGHALGTGWSSGTDDINGYTLPIDLSLNNRSDNQPSDYVATRSIELLTGFTSGDDDNFSVYIADDTYAGGGNVNGASGGVGGYRYGFNGQEKSDEIKGEGNSYTAQFWEYDPRIGRRWNLDPKPQISISDYTVLRNNPNYYNDVLGDSIIKFNISNSKYIHGRSSVYIDHSVIGKVQELLNYAENNGIHIQINSAFRTTRRQANLSGVKKGVKPAKPGSSIHNAGAAFDFAVYKSNSFEGNVTVDPRKNDDIVEHLIGEGWTWGGYFNNNYDPIHFDLRNSINKTKMISENQRQIDGENQMDIDESLIKREVDYQPKIGITKDRSVGERNSVEAQKQVLYPTSLSIKSQAPSIIGRIGNWLEDNSPIGSGANKIGKWLNNY